MSTVGIKETKEAGLGLIAVVDLIVAQLKDGAQAADLVAIASKIMADEALKAELLAAVSGWSQIPVECKDIDVAEVLELGQAWVPAILKALGK